MDAHTSTQTVSKLLTRENITLALSIFGSIGTLITFISSYLHTRKNLKIKISRAGYGHILLDLPPKELEILSTPFFPPQNPEILRVIT